MKTFVSVDSKLSDIIVDEPAVVTVLNRFGIRLGVGDSNIAKICNCKNIDRDFFVAIINTYLHEDYFPERIMASFGAKEIINYLRMTNVYYERFQIPNIERHFHFLISKTDDGENNLGLILTFFNEVKGELLKRIADDNSRWFPEVLALEHNTDGCATDTGVEQFDEGNDTIEDKIDDLINMFIIHLKGDFDNNLAYAVLTALVNLKKDIRQNNRIRNRILRPLAAALARQSES